MAPVKDEARIWFQEALADKRFVVGMVLVILLAIFFYYAASEGGRGVAETKRSAQEKSMQLELQKYGEDLRRQEIASDSILKASLMREASQFMMTLNYDAGQLNATSYEYDPGVPISRANFAAKAAAARKFAAQVNEYGSHVDGFKEFILFNYEDLKRMDESGSSGNASSLFDKLEASKEKFRQLELLAAADLEKFASSNKDYAPEAGEVVKLLKGETQ